MTFGTLLLFLPLLVHLVHLIRWSRGMVGAFTDLDPEKRKAASLPPRIGVVLPFRNEVNTLPLLLRDLARQSLLPAEVLLIDDASDDGTWPAVEQAGPWPFPLRCIANPGQGKKAGLSAGIAALDTPWAVGIDADTRLEPDALAAIADHLTAQGDGLDMALLPLRIANQAKGAPKSRLDRLQALDFAAMQGWAVAAVRRGHPAMASGGGWVWRCAAFPHDRLRPEIPSGDDVFSLAALLEDGRGDRVGWIGDRRAMVSAAAMPDATSLLDQRIRWGAKTTRYPAALKEARRVAWTISLVHLCGAILLLIQPWAGLALWGVKSAADMAYTRQVGRAYGVLPKQPTHALGDLLTLALAHPIFIATTLLLMPVRNVRWKGRSAT